MDLGMWVDEGLDFKLQVLTGQTPPPGGIWVILGTNMPFTPLPGWVFTDIVQPVWAGYAPAVVSGWLAPTGPVAGVWSVQGNNVVFSNMSGSPQTPTGFALATGLSPSDALLLAGAFGTPPVIPDAGAYVFTPVLTDQSA